MMLTNPTSMRFSSFSPWRAISLRKRDDFALIQLFVLRTLKTAVDCKESIPDMLSAAALELRGGARRDLLKLVQQIHSAGSLATACEQFPSLLDEETVLAIRLGEQLEILPDVLTDMIRVQRDRQLAKRYHPESTRFCWMLLIFVYLFWWSSLMYFIAPTMKKMLEEFGAESPWITQLAFQVADIASIYWPIILIGTVLLGISWISPRTERWLLSLFGFFRPLRFFQSPSGITKQLLAVAINQKKSLHKALSTLAKYHFHRKTRQRLLVARNDVELGTDSWRAVQSAGILNSEEVRFLSDHSDERLQAYFLKQLAANDWQQRERVVSFRYLLINPFITLLFGAFVALFSIGFFAALVYLIHALA
ncbi:MAG: type II secretion system F family protein [Pirellula sp.]|jgi:type II secretory pathway component PulF|nr:type II secretion system F family protein [Pirellula sp.]